MVYHDQGPDRKGIARSIMEDWRVQGVGPLFKRLQNGQPRLRRRDLEQWLNALPELA